MWARWMAAWVLAGPALGCGSKGAVSLNASIQNTQIDLKQQTLGVVLQGGFDLRLAVGSEASSGSTVSIESFALVRSADQSTLIGPLAVAPAAGFQFPVDVGKGQTEVVPFVFDASELIDPNLRDQICQQPVQVFGVLSDTLSGGTSPVSGEELTPDGC